MSILSEFHVYYGPDALTAPPQVRKLGARDCFAALAEGFDDFMAMPSHVAFLGLFYVVAGLVLAHLFLPDGRFGLFPHIARHADAGIPHDDPCVMAVAEQFDANLAQFRCEFDRVVQKDTEQPLEQQLVSFDKDWLAG